jgi:hypothetical protein
VLNDHDIVFVFAALKLLALPFRFLYNFKTRKLRASIADLSESYSRDMKEVERRGLEGGINLVRGIREELRDIEFQLSEIRSRKTECKTKISMIHARIPDIRFSLDAVEKNKTLEGGQRLGKNKISSSGEVDEDDEGESEVQVSFQNGNSPSAKEDAEFIEGRKTSSEKIATGDSQALAVIQPGSRGFFTVDLWQVILRIIGFDRAAYRRGVQVSASQPNVMIV